MATPSKATLVARALPGALAVMRRRVRGHHAGARRALLAAQDALHKGNAEAAGRYVRHALTALDGAASALDREGPA